MNRNGLVLKVSSKNRYTYNHKKLNDEASVAIEFTYLYNWAALAEVATNS